MHLRRLRHAVLLVGLLSVAACGASDPPGDAEASGSDGGASASTAAVQDAATDVAADGSTPAAAQNPPATAVNAAAAVLPDVEVIDVATGETMTLASLVATDKPTLFWAWAPY